MERLEKTILKNLIYNDEYVKKVFPFLDQSYFSDVNERTLFREIQEFIQKYQNPPSYESLVISLSDKRDIQQNVLNDCIDILNQINNDKDSVSDKNWLIDQTEKFCQDKAIYNAIMESVNILDDKSSKISKGEIPKLLSDALAVCFDNNVGHDYFDDHLNRYEKYHKEESKLKFDIHLLNVITKGGIPKKTLNMILAGTGVGKSLAMCHFAASFLIEGKNVLYITMEMSEEKISERIDTNLLNISINDLQKLSKEEYDKRISRIQQKTNGKLIIKEYPTASASALHFRNLLNDLKLKKAFKPDIIFIDYLNICCSSRLKSSSNSNSYTYIKSIAEELRGLAVEFNVPVFSATQTTRSGFSSSDPGLEDTSESFGLPATADFMFALVTNEELEKMNQIMVKQLKNRYSDPNYYKRFVIGVDRSKMKLFDVDDTAQKDISDSGQPDQPINKFGADRNKNKFNSLRV